MNEHTESDRVRNSYPSTAPVDALVKAAYAVVWGEPDDLHEGLLQSLSEALDDLREGGPYPDGVEDPTAPLRNTELGDVCVNHGGTFEGTYSDKLDPSDTDPQPICSEVDGGFAPYDQGCRFVEATDVEGRTEADWAAMGQDEFNRPEPVDESQVDAENTRILDELDERKSEHRQEIVTSLEDSTGELRSFLRCSCGVETDYIVHES